ncbi:hypothetical protein HG531_009933 [Fusarium graminearum]|nr:hypothetical protein HG531_009933 [Fusarium graminearum]
MDALETGGIVLVANKHSTGVPSHTRAVRSFGEVEDRFIGDRAAFHKADTLQLGQEGKTLNTLVCQVGATAKINVSNTVAVLDKFLDTLVGDVPTVTQMHVMQVLTKLRDSMNGCISDVPALCENKIAKARGYINDLLYSSIVALDHEGSHWAVADASALVKVNLEDVGAVLGESVNSVVLQLAAFIEFQLCTVTSRQSDHAFVGNTFTTRDVESLKSVAVLGDGVDGLLCNVLVVGDVECQKGVAVLHQGNQTGIGQVTAFGTPMLDWESLAPRKKSDSSLSAGAGEVEEDEDRESSRESAGAGLGLAAAVGVAAAAMSLVFDKTREALHRDADRLMKAEEIRDHRVILKQQLLWAAPKVPSAGGGQQ